MLIWLNNFDLVQVRNTPRNIDALSLLGEAGYHGRHAVIGARQILELLATEPDLSRAARAYYQWATEALTQVGALAARERHIVVDPAVVHPNQIGGVWHVPLTLLSSPEYSAVAELICENMDDCNLLTRFANIFVRSRMPLCTVTLRPVAGGGNTTVDSLLEVMNDPHPGALCVVDSDRELPAGAVGSTANRCIAAFEPSWRVDLEVLEERELENLIPVDISIRVVEDDGGDASLLRLVRLLDPDLAKYGCFKTGEKPCRFHNVPAGHQGRSRVQRALQGTAENHPKFRKCGAACQSCDCEIFPRLGPSFVRRVSEWLATASRRQGCLDPDQWALNFQALVAKVVSSGLAFPRRN